MPIYKRFCLIFFITKKINFISFIIKPLYKALLELNLAILDPQLEQAKVGSKENINYILNLFLLKLAIYKNIYLYIIKDMVNIKKAEAKLIKFRYKTKVTL